MYRLMENNLCVFVWLFKLLFNNFSLVKYFKQIQMPFL